MAKPKISKDAITFVIEKYQCESKAYSFPEIAKLLEKNFGIKVTYQAVSKCYHKNKDIVLNNSKTNLDNTKDNVGINSVSNKTNESKPIDLLARKKVIDEKVKSKKTGFDDDAGEDLTKNSIKNLLD